MIPEPWAVQLRRDFQGRGYTLGRFADAAGLHRRTLERQLFGIVAVSDTKLRLYARMLERPELFYVNLRNEGTPARDR